MNVKVHRVAPKGDSGLATRVMSAKVSCSFAGAIARANRSTMAVVRGRPSGLPVTHSRFANLRTAATHSLGDDLLVVSTI